jgi:hypothetical protein
MERTPVPSVVQFFDDEAGNERLFELDERRPPCGLAAVSREPLRQAAQQSVSRQTFDEDRLDACAHPASGARPHGQSRCQTFREIGITHVSNDRPSDLGGVPCDVRFRDAKITAMTSTVAEEACE